ncbi:MAG: FAD-binding oxidoreductase [Flavipsychrobacter sp.]|nr:FAD-binding oxidoreductase [Flavipsychrobacter sp.]
MISYWEQQSFIHYDHIIIGSGIVGLSTAIELKERFPSASVLVLERGLLPTGASSRNAGFACMGSVTELLDYGQSMSEGEILELYSWRKRGLEKLRNRLGDQAMGYAANGSYELLGREEVEEGALDKIEYLNSLLQPITSKPAFRLANDKIEVFGFSKEHTRALVENTCEGELHTGKMLRALMQVAMQLGVVLKTGAEVTRFEETERYVLVEVKDHSRCEPLALHAGALSICTNAFTRQLLPGEDVVPGRGQVLITQPIEGLRFKGVYHMDKGYYYFREVDGRVLIGGGRNLDFEAEATTEFALTEQVQVALERKLHEIILPGTPYLIEQRWAGIMAFGTSRSPIVKQVSDRVFGAFRMSGMGVALGSEVGMKLADVICLDRD